MIDILLINPPAVVFNGEENEHLMYLNPPIGLGYLASAVRKKNYSVDIVDMGAEGKSSADIINIIKNNNVKVIGITSFVANFNNGLKLAKILKEACKDIIVIMGGIHVSFIPEEALKNGIDIVSMFEGEETFVEVIDAIINKEAISDIQGIAYVKNGEIIKNSLREPIENLDDISFPAWDLFDLKVYPEPGIILTGRGCKYKCAFCCAPAIPGVKYRKRSAKNVVDEIEYLYNKYNLRQYFFADYTFTTEYSHCEAICREIIKRNLDIKWEAEARANTINEGILSIMKEAGCTQIQIGVESGDDYILQSIQKGTTTNMIYDSVKCAIKMGINVTCSFIIGHAKDTEESIERTIEFAKKLKYLAPKNVKCMFALMTPLPGTEIFEKREELNIKLLSSNWDKFTFYDPIAENENLDRRTLQNLFNKAWLETSVII